MCNNKNYTIPEEDRVNDEGCKETIGGNPFNLTKESVSNAASNQL